MRCERCFRTAKRYIRTLCPVCYETERRRGQLANYRRNTRTWADTAEDAEVLLGRGWELPRIAAEFGVLPYTVVRAVERHQRQLGERGDEVAARAVKRIANTLQRQYREIRPDPRSNHHRRSA